MESASSGLNAANLGFDSDKLHEEAGARWLKPSEVLFILQNHERYPLTLEAPQKPASGSLFLFNRRVLRFFRKDGHLWKKKKDGRTLGEAHERLKVGNVDALHCYYAHGEKNPYFQRRSYWMLDPAYEHIVLVHYREVDEGRFSFGSKTNLLTESFSTLGRDAISRVQFGSLTCKTCELEELYQNSSLVSVDEISPDFSVENFEMDDLNAIASGQLEVKKVLRRLTMQLSLNDIDYNFTGFKEDLPAYWTQDKKSQILGFPDYVRCSQKSHMWQAEESGNEANYGGMELHNISDVQGKQKNCSLGLRDTIKGKQSPSWNDLLELTSNTSGTNINSKKSDLLESLESEEFPEPPSCRISAVETEVLSIDLIKGKQSPSLNNLLELNISCRPPNFLGSEKLPEPPRCRDTLLSCMERVKEPEKLNSVPFDHGVDAVEKWPKACQSSEDDLHVQLPAAGGFMFSFDNPIYSPTLISEIQEIERLGVSENTTLEANSNVVMLSKGNSTDWLGAFDLTVENNAYCGDLTGILFDQSYLTNDPRIDTGLTLAQKQLFLIREISPEWAFSCESTKVIITGDFLCPPSETRWAIMFGEIEVPLEIVQKGVLRCRTPMQRAGIVTLCVTSGNRESCSEIRKFEFRENPNTSCFIGTSPKAESTKSSEEVSLLVRFACILLCGYDGLITSDSGTDQESEFSIKLQTTDDPWQQNIEALLHGCEWSLETLDWILQELLKDKLQHWLMGKYQEKDGTGCLLSKQEQGIIHMISGLGYEWALNPILESGVGINTRDTNGWTSLHWAARFGREKMVAALLAVGASAGAVTDPTPQDPVGRTPGAISASNGHKGLAGYLSEIALKNHLASLTLEECEITKGSAAVNAEVAIEKASLRTIQFHAGTEDELSLKDSLEASRNAALAAARIQAAFRARSFRRLRLEASGSHDDYGMTLQDIHWLSAAMRSQRSGNGYRDQKLDKAALSIQKKYRAWKGRKDFLTLRKQVVKIQAHFRGHQVRKKFKEVLWTVSIVEKVILRWRRRGVGLRGYRAKQEMIDEAKDEEILRYFRKQKVDVVLEEAVSRVFSMVESPDARNQYRRMLQRYRKNKGELSNLDEASARLLDYEILENYDYMY